MHRGLKFYSQLLCSNAKRIQTLESGILRNNILDSEMHTHKHHRLPTRLHAVSVWIKEHNTHLLVSLRDLFIYIGIDSEN